MCRHTDSPQTLSPDLTAAVLAAAFLELKAEKQGAHSDSVFSVAFSPDGTTIVSGSSDHSIKVWDAGALALIALNLQPKTDRSRTAPLPAAASLELKAQKQSAHSKEVYSVAFSPDGKTILSGSGDESIKVWDSGVSALTHPNP